MSDSKFKTMRHIETVRNYLNCVISEVLLRQEQHDQTKLQSPEVEIFEEYTPKLKNSDYGSDEYNRFLAEMKVALNHHYKHNRHHPEHFKNGISGMNLIDLIEMMCDWKAASMRHKTGDIYKSIDINQERFGYGDELKTILKNTADKIISMKPFNVAEES